MQGQQQNAGKFQNQNKIGNNNEMNTGVDFLAPYKRGN
jgi:hypothetical protein